MAITGFQKIRVVLYNGRRYPFLDFLQREGVMEVEDVSGKVRPELLSSFEKEGQEYDLALAQLDFAIKFLGKTGYKKQRSFKEFMLGEKEVVDAVEVEEVWKNFFWKEVVEKSESLSEEKLALELKLKNFEEEKKTLWGWEKWNESLAMVRESKRAKLVFVVLSEVGAQKAKEAFKKIKGIEIKMVGEKGSEKMAVCVCLKEQEAEMREVLNQAGASEVALPVREGTPAEELKKLIQEEKVVRGDLEKNLKKALDLASNLEKLKIVYDVMMAEKERHLACQKFYHSHKTATVQGWVRQEDLSKIEAELKRLCEDEYLLQKVKPEKGEEVPVEIANGKAVWPFEMVTGIYGLPRSTDPDPTPYLSAFFIIFFGLCLTDAMYGLTLSILAFMGLKFFKMRKVDKKLFVLLGWGGLVTFVLGALFGGWFGLTVEQAPAFLTTGEGEEKKFIFQLINPTQGNGPLTFLILAFAIGVVHLLFGIFVDGYWKVKTGRTLEAILGPFLWLFTLISGILAVALGGAMVNVFLLGILTLLMTQGREALEGFGKKSVGGKVLAVLSAFFKGVLSLYNMVGYCSDVLSYSRLMALGLGTGIIAFAVNTIATIVYQMIPYVGFLVAILVLIVGHLANLALSALGAFIHSGRLQYVEFFGKFLEGGGRAFKPLNTPRKHTISSKEF